MVSNPCLPCLLCCAFLITVILRSVVPSSRSRVPYLSGSSSPPADRSFPSFALAADDGASGSEEGRRESLGQSLPVLKVVFSDMPSLRSRAFLCRVMPSSTGSYLPTYRLLFFLLLSSYILRDGANAKIVAEREGATDSVMPSSSSWSCFPWFPDRALPTGSCFPLTGSYLPLLGHAFILLGLAFLTYLLLIEGRSEWENEGEGASSK